MRIRKTISVLLTAAIVAGMTYCVSADNLRLEVQDFENMEEGALASDKYFDVICENRPSDYFDIANDGNSNLIHYKYESCTAQYPEMSYTWGLPAGNYICVRYDFMLINSEGSVGLWLINRKGDDLPVPILISGGFVTFNWGGGKYEKIGDKLLNGKWYTMTVFSDVSAQKFHTYVFEKDSAAPLFGCTRNFRSKVGDIGKLYIKQQNTTAMEMYVDNIRVTASNSSLKFAAVSAEKPKAGRNTVNIAAEAFDSIFGAQTQNDDTDDKPDGEEIFRYDCDGNGNAQWANSTVEKVGGVGGKADSDNSAYVSLSDGKNDGFIQYSHTAGGQDADLTKDYDGCYVIDFKFFAGEGFDGESMVRVSANQGRLVSSEVKTSSPGYKPGQWNKVRVIYNTKGASAGFKGTKTTYLNNKLVSGPDNWNISADINCLRIGVAGNPGTKKIAYIDDAAIYKTAEPPEVKDDEPSDDPVIPDFEPGIFANPIVIIYENGSPVKILTGAVDLQNQYAGAFNSFGYDISDEKLTNSKITVKVLMWKSLSERINVTAPVSAE